MQGFHIPAAPPLYTNTFLLISDAGHAVVIDRRQRCTATMKS